MTPRLSIALLTEDRSEATWRGLKAILEKLLRRFDERGAPIMEVVPVDPQFRPILTANRWRSRNVRDEQQKRELWRYIARKIAEPGGFVVFHYDGDTPWSQRGHSSGTALFERELRVRVEQVLNTSQSKLSTSDIQSRMRRLIPCVPFYSVEAWTYQATDAAVRLCHQHHRGLHAELFRAWASDRSLLDDVLRPKEATCLRDDHNDQLGRQVPVAEVVNVGQSLTAFVWALHSSELRNWVALG